MIYNIEKEEELVENEEPKQGSMKIYGLILKSWIIDERCYAGEDYTIEVYESKEHRDERLLYLNRGKIYDEYKCSLDYFYDGFEVEIGAHSEYNSKPIEL